MSFAPRPVVVKVDATRYRLDTLTNRFIDAGFQVVKATSIKEGLKVARRCKPNLIVAIDNLRSGLDAVQWLELQHSDVEGALAMTPLLIVTDNKRVESLRIHELPDRVKVLQRSRKHEAVVNNAQRLLGHGHF